MGSWDRDTGALSPLMDRAENGKRKTFPFSFLNRFCYPLQEASMGFSHSIVSIAPRQGTCPHHQEYWLLDKKTPSIEKVFLITSQKLFLAPAQYKKKLTSLYSICAASTVFLKTSSSLSRAAALSRQTAPRCRFYSTTATGVFIV
jgi:hypothetical protein